MGVTTITMDNNIRDYYVEKHPTDVVLGNTIYPFLTFDKLWTDLENDVCPYETIGVFDSIVREGCFEGLAKYKGVSYNTVYKLWLKNK